MKLLLAVLLTLPLAAQRKPGNQLDNLPSNMEVLTHFGERADISPDNQRVAFMAKSFGDAMTINVKTREIRCLTCNVPGAAFLRVMHLVTGDYILIGPARFADIRTSRSRDNELWFLGKERGAKPIRLGQKMSEGAAISKKSLKIAFSQLHDQAPELAPEASRLMVADVDLSATPPKLVNQKTVYESKDRSCVLEAQDFYDNDSKMIFTCYEPQSLASVMGIDLRTGAVTNFSKAPGHLQRTRGHLPRRAVHVRGRRPAGGAARRQARRQQHRYLEAETRRHREGFRAAHPLQRLRKRQGVEPGGVHGRALHGVSNGECQRSGGRGIRHRAVLVPPVKYDGPHDVF
jgi:hypothetical protein